MQNKDNNTKSIKDPFKSDGKDGKSFLIYNTITCLLCLSLIYFPVSIFNIVSGINLTLGVFVLLYFVLNGNIYLNSKISLINPTILFMFFVFRIVIYFHFSSIIFENKLKYTFSYFMADAFSLGDLRISTCLFFGLLIFTLLLILLEVQTIDYYKNNNLIIYGDKKIMQKISSFINIQTVELLFVILFIVFLVVIFNIFPFTKLEKPIMYYNLLFIHSIIYLILPFFLSCLGFCFALLNEYNVSKLENNVDINLLLEKPFYALLIFLLLTLIPTFMNDAYNFQLYQLSTLLIMLALLLYFYYIRVKNN